MEKWAAKEVEMVFIDNMFMKLAHKERLKQYDQEWRLDIVKQNNNNWHNLSAMLRKHFICGFV